MIKSIVIIGAMDLEVNVLKHYIQTYKVEDSGNARIYYGKVNGVSVYLIRSMIGMVNCAHAATIAIERFNPDILILQGTAGAHTGELNIGDIVLGETIIEIGSFYTSKMKESEGTNYRLWDFPGVEMSGNDDSIERVRKFHSDEKLMSMAQSISNPQFKVKKGIIGSSDIWNKELDYINYLHNEYGTYCEEMEGFSFAQICTEYKKPFIVIRSISNSEMKGIDFNTDICVITQEFTIKFIEKIVKEEDIQ